MNLEKKRPLWQFKWHIIVISTVIIVVLLLATFTDIFQAISISQLLWFLSALVILTAILTILAQALKILNVLGENGATLDKVAGMLEKNSSFLRQISQNTRLSETAKTIAFRDADRQSLREAVFDKLQQQDFDAAFEIIDEIAHSTMYQELVKQLRTEANKYRDATDTERANQIIVHIEKLFESYQWAKASILIERLNAAFPKSEKAKAMRQKLLDKKEEHKKLLLSTWDEAVKRQTTDRSLEILRELDLYLTPNEGLALQEAARDVFRNKLHNLGVQFSLAVSGKQWGKAIETGLQIIHDFPNSKMAEEIRGKMNILKQNIKKQS